MKLFGRPFTRDDRELRRLVGIGTQDLSIYPDLTARENLRFFGKLYGFRGTDLNTRVDDVLAAVGLTDRANDRAGTFSGGMKRPTEPRFAAVVHGPKLLFLDEPTTGVDPQSRNHIFEQVRALSAAGLTIIYASHYMEEVQAAMCPRIRDPRWRHAPAPLRHAPELTEAARRDRPRRGGERPGRLRRPTRGGSRCEANAVGRWGL